MAEKRPRQELGDSDEGGGRGAPSRKTDEASGPESSWAAGLESISLGLNQLRKLQASQVELKEKLRTVEAARIPECLGGIIALLVTLARKSEAISKADRTLAWETLMADHFPRMVCANHLDNMIKTPSIDSEEMAVASKEAWVASIAEWKDASYGLSNRLTGSESGGEALVMWFSCGHPEDINTTYSITMMTLLMIVLRAQIRVEYYQYTGRNGFSSLSSAAAASSETYSGVVLIVDPVTVKVSEDMVPDTTTAPCADWTSAMKTHLDSAADTMVVTCIGLIRSAAQPSEGDIIISTEEVGDCSWFVLQMDKSSNDVRVYMCGNEWHRVPLHRVFETIIQGFLDPKDDKQWQVYVEDPFRVIHNELSVGDSGPLAVWMAGLLARQPDGEVVRNGHFAIAQLGEKMRTERIRLSQHLSLFNSFKCNQKLLKLCTDGKANL